MFTRSGWVLLVGSTSVLVAGRLLGLPEFHLLGVVGIALCAVAFLLVRRAPGLSFERVVVPLRVHVGSPSRVELRVTNRSARRSSIQSMFEPVEGTVGVSMAIAPLAPGAVAAASYRLPTSRRGLLSVGPLTAERTDVMGLVRRRITAVDKTHLTVLPTVIDLGAVLASEGLQDPSSGSTRPVLGARGTGDLASLRPYVAGDDLRRVHWPTSARVGDLILRQDDLPWQGRLTILLDDRADRIDGGRFEEAVSAAASIAATVANTGDRVRLIIGGQADTGMVDAITAGDVVLEHLAIAERRDGGLLTGPSGATLGPSGGIVVLAGMLDVADQRVLAAAAEHCSPIVVFTFHPGAGPTSPGVVHYEVPADAPFASAWATAIRGAG